MASPDPFPEPEPSIDEIVRAQLDAEAARIDPNAVAKRVLARLTAEAPPAPVPRRSWRRAAAFAGALALAASVLLAVFALSGPREVVASPAQVVQGARSAYTRNDTRCYRVTLDTRAREAFPLLAPEVTARTLCTRGDRFVVEPGFGGKGAWGSDGSGRVWVAPTPDGAAAFDESELPQALRNVVKVHELELDTLLDEVLSAFDLTWSRPPERTAGTDPITATRRGEVAPLRLASAELVIEKNTKVIRSLTLHRKTITGGNATLTFTLLATVPKDDAVFTPEGHIRPGAPVYDRTKPLLRRRLMIQNHGEGAVNGL